MSRPRDFPAASGRRVAGQHRVVGSVS